MSLRANFRNQFQRPDGLLGTLAGWIMAHRPSNRARNRWTVDLMGLTPDARVLELGFGPGLSIGLAAERAYRGSVVGIDHSEVMLRQAIRRNQSWIDSGRVELRLGGMELLPELGVFTAIFSVNMLQFDSDRRLSVERLHQALAPDGLLATTYQPRHHGARPSDADRFAQSLSREMAASFHSIRIEVLPLRPVPAICVLGRAS
jgi:SAM-dependent methyltransferase